MAKDFSTLGWDYAVFFAFIAFSTFVPLWSRLFGNNKQKNKADYVFATGSVSIIAMMLSIARGTLGIRSVLGYPSELFYRGSAMWEVIYGMVNAYPIVCFVFVPVYFNLGITSVYQYIDLRFKSRLVRCLASATYILRQMCSLGITVYTPSVALATVIGIPYWISIVGMSAICIFFTIIGGLKAAINADVIQSCTVIAVTMAVIIQGAIESGGVKNVYNSNLNNGRLKFFNFTGDMTVRVDTTSAWFGQLFMSLSQFGCQQNFMQRYVSLKSLKEVNKVMMSNIPVIVIFFSLSWISGMVIYSTYVNCDPLGAGYIQKTDEILPFFVEDKLSFIPGFVGIFMATLFNGALSMNVSNLNSLATVIWEDFLSHLPNFKGLNDKQQLGVIKCVAGIAGILIMGIAFCVGLLTGVIESSMLAFSATSGPLLGVFILAMLIPVANWKGASAGMIVAHCIIMWITFGGLTLNNSNNSKLPTSTEGCSNFTFSSSIYKPQTPWLAENTPLEISSWANNVSGYVSTTTEMPPIQRTTIETIYSISYMYYSLIGTLITVTVGVIVSYLTRTKDDEYDSKLLHPVVFRISEWMPGTKPYFVRDTSDSTLNETITKGTVHENHHDNLAYEKHPADDINRIEFVTKKTSDIPQANEIKDKNSNSLSFEIPKSNTLHIPHPDIMEIKHWESKDGVYRKTEENDLV